jgi:hypothetical protein
MRVQSDREVEERPDAAYSPGAPCSLFHAYHNFMLPHASLRLPLPELEPISKSGAIKRWQPRTPAMAAGLTDRVWSVREVLMCRVPPWPQAQMG